jgi:DNA-directed RNA polymerase subunit M/transcription elongation factor TFIIS
MLCPKCGQPMYAKAIGSVVEGDNSPDTETTVCFVQELTCSKCGYKEIARHPQPIIKLEG